MIGANQMAAARTDRTDRTNSFIPPLYVHARAHMSVIKNIGSIGSIGSAKNGLERPQ
jgi:hypothetical protein